MNIDDLFETVVTFPDASFHQRYEALVGLDTVKERLEKEAEALLRPDLLEKWSTDKHSTRLPALDLLLGRPPLFIFAGDVGTGKTELASTFGDRLARTTKLPVELFCLSLRARGSGAVGEMTTLISEAFRYLRSHSSKKNSAGKKGSSTILLIDEADALAQSRELAQMHHEDRAGVNALIRGIDDIAGDRLACLTIMCTNRLSALDPAIQRRAAAVFQFERPNLEMRQRLLSTYLEGTGISTTDIKNIAEQLGKKGERSFGHTFSDITQRFIPSLVLAAYPSKKISIDLALQIASTITPTPPFTAE
ncbi:MAG: AAA family ATPase [Micavibrio sp.]|jgi:AAA+ superfamily predicted ATPase|nr:AAA family ATPase [Micavibrio sp.]MBP7720972.1 AAA family ATPase [Alphaproteobacteria bacterium]